MIRLEILRVV